MPGSGRWKPLHTPHASFTEGSPPDPQASQVRPESPSPEAHSQRGPPPGALLRREDTRPASKTAGALASPSDLFHLGIGRQMDRVSWGGHSGLETRALITTASVGQYCVFKAAVCLPHPATSQHCLALSKPQRSLHLTGGQIWSSVSFHTNSPSK